MKNPTKHVKRSVGNRKALRRKRAEARRLREERGLCLCGDEVRPYRTAEEANVDTQPNAVCTNCGKQKLIIQAIVELPSNADWADEASIQHVADVLGEQKKEFNLRNIIMNEGQNG